MQIGGFFYQPCRKLREPMVQVVAASPITYLNDFLAYYDCCDVQNCFVYYAKNMRSYIHICKKNAKRQHIGTLHSLYSWSNSNRVEDSFKKRNVGVAVAFEAESTK